MEKPLIPIAVRTEGAFPPPQKNVSKAKILLCLLAGFHCHLLEEAFLRCCKLKIFFLLVFGSRVFGPCGRSTRSLLARSGFAHEGPFSLQKKTLSLSPRKNGEERKLPSSKEGALFLGEGRPLQFKNSTPPPAGMYGFL